MLGRHPTKLDNSRARNSVLAVGASGGKPFFSSLSSLFFLPVSWRWLDIGRLHIGLSLVLYIVHTFANEHQQYRLLPLKQQAKLQQTTLLFFLL